MSPREEAKSRMSSLTCAYGEIRQENKQDQRTEVSKETWQKKKCLEGTRAQCWRGLGTLVVVKVP